MPPTPYLGEWKLVMVGGLFDGLQFTHPGLLPAPTGWLCQVILGEQKQTYEVYIQDNKKHILSMRPHE